MYSEDVEENIIIRAKNLGKRYRIYEKPIDRLLEAFPFQGKRSRDFWALRKISFELERGQTLGIVGRNGSGKSTLLQLLSGILTPSEGDLQTQGRIGALLELGSGFNPEFSGIENIFLNGSVLGLSQDEIQDNLQKILDFANIGEFASQAVKTYSSGMSVRLAFAVQALLKPDILIVDEALAVGDELFQKKCYNHIRRLKEQGTSILLVTHNSHQILQHCDVALLLHQGEQILWGTPKLITSAYQRLMSSCPDGNWRDSIQQLKEQRRASEGESALGSYLDPSLKPDTSENYPEQGGRILNVSILNRYDEAINSLDAQEPFSIVFEYEVDRDCDGLQFGCHIANTSGLRITGQGFPGSQKPGLKVCAGSRLKLKFHFSGNLQPGLYFIGGGFWEEHAPETYLHRVLDRAVLRIVSAIPLNSMGICHLTSRDPEVIREGQEVSSDAAGAGWNMNIE